VVAGTLVSRNVEHAKKDNEGWDRRSPSPLFAACRQKQKLPSAAKAFINTRVSVLTMGS
jgi:hypothetical protein